MFRQDLCHKIGRKFQGGFDATATGKRQVWVDELTDTWRFLIGQSRYICDRLIARSDTSGQWGQKSSQRAGEQGSMILR